jgi:hypothetical protein
MFRSAIRTCLVVILLILAAERTFAARTETWEVRSPNFLFLTDGSETQVRRIALQFELIRAVFRQFFNIPGAAKDPLITIIAVKNADGLKRLLPEGGSSPPGGVFVDSWEKKYIALRLDRLEIEATAAASGQRTFDPYASLHRGYVQFLADRLPTELPLWMMEGLTEFFGNAKVEYRQIVFGAPSDANIEVLHATKLLPLATLFAVDTSSPYYHQENRRSIYYAQSWLLMKYLVTRDWREGTHRVTDFVGLLEQMEPEEAARRTIGDPVSLEKELPRYLRFHLYSTAGLPMPPSLDANAFTAAPAPPAELEAMQAAFMALDGHSAMEESESKTSEHPNHPERPELEPNPTMAEGIIEKAECSGGTTLDVTVKTGSGEIHLYSDRYQELLYTALNFTLKERVNPCRDLQGWHARLSYRPAQDPANPGEMMAVVLVLVKD